MLRFIPLFILIYLIWLILTFSISISEIVVGFFVSIIITALSKDVFFKTSGLRILNPFKWLRFVLYIFVFIIEEIIAHIYMGYRIITGKINPAIVKIVPSSTTEIGKTILGNFITLTPGTLTLHINNNLYIHCINVGKKAPGAMFKKVLKDVI